MTRRSKAVTAALVGLAMAGCADEMPRDVQEATTPPRPEQSQLDTGANVPLDPAVLPAGGYVQWIAEIREELDVIRGVADDDRSEALALLQQMYVSRFEPLQDHFGEGGSHIASDAMAQAVERAGSLLRDLMRELAESDPATGIGDGVAAAHQALAEAEAEGMAAGLPPEAPRN